MSFLMSIKEYRDYLTSGIMPKNAFVLDGIITSEMQTRFSEYCVKSEDIFLNLTYLARWSEFNDGPNTPHQVLQAIRSKVCDQSSGTNFDVGVYMVRYILATNHYSLPWNC